MVLCVAIVIALTAGQLSAAMVACPTMTDLQTLINTTIGISNACISQDKIFWNFTYTPGPAAPPASGVSASLIAQSGGGFDIHGWNFSSVWSQNVATGALANFTLSYLIQVCRPTDPCAGNVVPGTLINAADAVYAPSSVFPPGSETVTWSNGATVTLTNGSPGPQPSNGNIGLGSGTAGVLGVTAMFSGSGAITQTTLRFYETVPTGIPEPTTLGLILGGVGLIGVGGYRRKKRVL
jgi:hypothetical protein